MNWIADTNVISETKRSQPDANVMRWFEEVPVERLFTTIVNFAELRYGVLSQPAVERAQELGLWLERTVRPLFKDRVLGVEEDVVLSWRTISREAQKQRRPAPPGDLLVAAIALVNHCGVATRDVEPFAGAGVPTLNPWTGERFNGA